MTGRSPPPNRPAPSASAADAVRAVVEPVVSAAGLDLEDVQLRQAGGRQVLRILLDTDGGITLDQVAEVSTALSAALDDSGAMAQRSYVLDVGSPGVDRPLSLHRHWRRNIGRLVRVTGTDGSVRTGRIVSVAGPADDAAPESVSLDFGQGAEPVPAASLRRAMVQIEFAAAQSLED